MLGKLVRDCKANVAVTFALAVVPLIAATGFAVDNARMSLRAAELQDALDAAVLAAANEVGESEEVRLDVAARYMAANFARDFSEGPTFLIEGDIVRGFGRLAVPLAFMPIIGITTGSVERAAAAVGFPGSQICLLALGADADEGIRLIGTTGLEAINCAIHTNSTSETALHSVGGSQASADSICAVGNYVGDGFSPTPRTGCRHVNDPFDLPLPPSADGPCNYSNQRFKNGTFFAMPGVYCGGLDAQTHSTVLLEPGIYIMRDGPLEMSAHSEMIGEGVVFYFYGENAVLNMHSGAGLDIVAPASGPYAGVAFTQHRESSVGETNLLAGGPDVRIVGAFHVPTQVLDIRGGTDWAGTAGYFPMVAHSFVLRGNAMMTTAADHEGAGHPDQLARTPGGVWLTQ